MEIRQDMARSRIGHGLDRLFERQLDEDSNRVQLVAKLHLSPELVGTYAADYCAKGFNDAFEDVLGADVTIVREFARADLPRGITAPDGVDTVYAVAFDGGDGSQWDSACEHCKPSGGGESTYSMRNMDCVCVVTPP